MKPGWYAEVRGVIPCGILPVPLHPKRPIPPRLSARETLAACDEGPLCLACPFMLAGIQTIRLQMDADLTQLRGRTLMLPLVRWREGIRSPMHALLVKDHTALVLTELLGVHLYGRPKHYSESARERLASRGITLHRGGR